MGDLWWLLELVISICVVGIIGYGFSKVNEENFGKKRRKL